MKTLISPTALKLIIGLHRHVNAIDRQTSQIANRHGLTFSQFAVLEALFHKGDMTVGSIQKHILSSPGTIPLIINNLTKAGYTTRLSHPQDKRACIVSLTKSGRNIIKQAMPENASMIEAYFSHLNHNEQELLLNLLKKIGEKNEPKN